MASRENPVNWLLGNRELLAFLFVAVAWLAQKLGGAKNRKAATGERPKGAAVDDGEAERTRRVQEEIRRRIAERRLAAPPVLAPLRADRKPVSLGDPQPAGSEPGGLWGGVFQTEIEESQAASPSASDVELAAVLARQRELEEKMRRLESASSAASAEAGGISAGARTSPFSQTGMAMPPVSSAPPNAWLSQLRERQGARNAMVLREVMGPPVGLR
jgi:hypothetical protein